MTEDLDRSWKLYAALNNSIENAITDARQASTESVQRHLDSTASRQTCFSRASKSLANARSNFIELCEHFTSPAESAISGQQERTFWMSVLTAISLLNLACLIFIGRFFTRHIISRLTVIIDNNSRFIQNQKLNPPVSGNDEIADLDSSFHQMADSLKESTRSYMAVIANAQDLVCSLDDQGRFVLVSPSARSLGYEPQALKDAKLLDIVLPQDRQNTAARLQSVIETGREDSFETTLLSKNNLPVNVICSASWSPVDRTTFCVAHDVSGRKAAERLQKIVMQMVSQDMRNPLSEIAAFHESLAEGVHGQLSEKAQRNVGICRRATQRMLMLINDLIDAEQMESGTLTLVRAQVELDPVIEHSIQAVAMQAQEMGVSLEATPSSLSVFADANRLVQVLVNLLTNAIKFSPRGGLILVSAVPSPDSNFARIEVKDQGRGIPLEMQRTIFDRFSQVKASDASVKGGTGLGLAICKALVELHGGEINVESEPNKGSTFAFSIRLNEEIAAAAAADSVADSRQGNSVQTADSNERWRLES